MAKRWSQRVTEESNALDLEHEVFNKDDPRAIALSLKRSAEHSRRRMSDPYRPGDVDADLLHQPGREEPSEATEGAARKSQG